MKIHTLEQFIAAVADGQDAYDLFEYDTTDEVRDEIYALAPADADEPFRAAMATLDTIV